VIQAQEGTTIEATKPISEGIDTIISQVPEIKSYTITTRAGRVIIETVLVGEEERERDSFVIQKDILDQL
jgi:hypothetical protein